MPTSGHFRKPIGFSAFSTRTGEFTYIIPEVGLKLAWIFISYLLELSGWYRIRADRERKCWARGEYSREGKG